MSNKWIKWTVFEACAKTISKILQKIIGVVSVTFGHTLLATLVVGFVQVVGSFVMIKVKKVTMSAEMGDIVGSCVFGFNAALCTVLPFYVFVLGGDIGINTFLVTLSIIPGALIDMFFFKHRLNLREWTGIGIAMFAGYAILGWPSLGEVMQLPLWVWLSLLIALIVSINQGVTQKIKKIDPFVKNFWGGLTTFVVAFFALFVSGNLHLLAENTVIVQKIWLTSSLVGLVVIAMWTYNLYSYKSGAHIAAKKLVMNGTYLSLAMVSGICFFEEQLTVAKIAGVVLYLIAFTFIDKETFKYFSGLLFRK